MGLAVIWPNKFLSGEFRDFRGKVVISGFGCRHGDLMVIKNVAGQNLYNMCYRLGCLF